MSLNKLLILLHYSFRAMGYIQTKINLPFLNKEENSVFSLPTYILTPWCRVLLEKLTGFQLVKKFPAFHETRRFITALTSVRQLSLPWTRPIQFIYPHPTSWTSILILYTHLRLGLPSVFSLETQNIQCYTSVYKNEFFTLKYRKAFKSAYVWK